LLEVNNLVCGYGGEAVVKNVSFCPRQGDIGLSAGRKAAVAKALCCVLWPVFFANLGECKISLQGPSHQPTRSRSAPKKRRIGMVFRITRSFRNLSIADNVGFV